MATGIIGLGRLGGALARGLSRTAVPGGLYGFIVRDTMAGTVMLQEQDGIDGDEVVWRVAHPGGSTEKGLAVIERRFPSLVEELLRDMGKW